MKAHALPLSYNHETGGPHSIVDSVLSLNPMAQGSILGIPKNFSLDDAEIY